VIGAGIVTSESLLARRLRTVLGEQVWQKGWKLDQDTALASGAVSHPVSGCSEALGRLGWRAGWRDLCVRLRSAGRGQSHSILPCSSLTVKSQANSSSGASSARSTRTRVSSSGLAPGRSNFAYAC